MDQFYVFEGPDGWAWCDMFVSDGEHVLPTPFKSVERAVAEIERRNPGCVVDTLDPSCGRDFEEAYAMAVVR